MSGWRLSQPQATTGASLNLSQTGAPAMNGMSGMPAAGAYSGYAAPANAWYNQSTPQNNTVMTGMLSGMGIDPNYAQAPLAPPTDTEILLTMLNTMSPIERFILSGNFQLYLDLLATINTFTVLNLLKNIAFEFDEDNGVFKIDVSKLPPEYQTLSVENVSMQISQLQSSASNEVNIDNNERGAILQRAEQSMFQGALNHALSDPGVLQTAAETGGSALRALILGRK